MIINSNFLVARAKQLADLENSYFISDEENKALLNESFQMVYQSDINEGDSYYLKSAMLEIDPDAEKITNAKTYKLPVDFYQLSSVTDKDEKTLLQRKAISSKFGYRLSKDSLTIFGWNREPKLFYYPLPQIIEYSSEDDPTQINRDTLTRTSQIPSEGQTEDPIDPPVPPVVTEVDVPNNWFVNYLSYYLAIQYNAKQNGNKPLLNELYSVAKEEFFNQLKRDTLFPVRITNVRVR